MKIMKSIMATTHIDRQREMLTKGALEDAVKQLQRQYLPVMWEHDVRYPPIGRVVSGEVIKLPDGHFALEATSEMFEESDSPDLIADDGREIPIRYAETNTFRIQNDRAFRDTEGQALIDHLHDISQEDEKPTEFLKKSLDPIPVLLIASGVYIIGSIAKGFLSKLGSDIYEKLRDTLKQYYREKKKSPNRYLTSLFPLTTMDRKSRSKFCWLIRRRTLLRNCLIHDLRKSMILYPVFRYESPKYPPWSWSGKKVLFQSDTPSERIQCQ